MISRRRGGFDVLISGFERVPDFEVLVFEEFPVAEALVDLFFLVV